MERREECSSCQWPAKSLYGKNVEDDKIIMTKLYCICVTSLHCSESLRDDEVKRCYEFYVQQSSIKNLEYPAHTNRFNFCILYFTVKTCIVCAPLLIVLSSSNIFHTHIWTSPGFVYSYTSPYTSLAPEESEFLEEEVDTPPAPRKTTPSPQHAFSPAHWRPLLSD